MKNNHKNYLGTNALSEKPKKVVTPFMVGKNHLLAAHSSIGYTSMVNVLHNVNKFGRNTAWEKITPIQIQIFNKP